MTEQELKKTLDLAEKEPQKIAMAVTGLPDKVLNFKPVPEKWSIREILAHLADIELVYGFRMRQMLSENSSTITPVNQDSWSQKMGYNETSAPESIAQFGLLRRSNLRLLRRIKTADLKRGAFHPEMQREFTLEELLGRIAKHGSSHLEQIEKLKKEAMR
jgi:DinB superfamily